MRADEKLGREQAKTRSGGTCEANVDGVCTGWGQSVHHRKNRSQGGTWDAANLMHICGDGVRGCHGWITEHPAGAREHGWAVRGHQDPADVMVRYRGRMAWLTNDGEVVPCEHVDAMTLHNPAYGDYLECADCAHQFNPEGGTL